MTEPTPRYASLADWIARESIPCSLDPAHADAFDAAVDRIVAALGDVDILGFGETLHGGEDILLLRNRLFQRLATAHGFTAIALESSYPRGRFVNQYITGDASQGMTSIDAALDAGVSHGFGKLAANRELVEWMRQHNADASRRVASGAPGSPGSPGTPPLHFYGFDQPAIAAGPASPRQSLHSALDHLAALDAAAAQPLRERIDPLLGDDARWENPMIWRDPAAAPKMLDAVAALRLATEDLHSALSIRAPQLIAAAGGGDEDGLTAHLDAVHDTVVARNLLNFFVAMAHPTDYAPGLAVRDAAMVDNVLHIWEREQRRAKPSPAGGVRIGRGQGEGSSSSADSASSQARDERYSANPGVAAIASGPSAGTSSQSKEPSPSPLPGVPGRGPRLLLFAHNMHLKRGEAVMQMGPARIAWWPAGAHLASRLGPRYAVIGTALGSSEPNAIAPAEPGTLESHLLATPGSPGPIRFIPTHHGEHLPPAALAALKTRSSSKKNGSYFPLNPASLTDYDAIATLDTTAYPRGGPPLPA